jgi:EAL domain-containing protein (putative c-di-GMP-specific phosphodiesterase class I)
MKNNAWTDDHPSKLKAMGCEYAQGFLFAEPVDSEAAGTLLGKSFADVGSK